MGNEQIQHTLSWDNLLVALVVIFVLATQFVLFGQVVTTIRNLRKPKEKQEENLTVHQSECNTRFETGERMMAQHERDIRDLKEGQRVQCVALHALLEHALHNGNKEDMERASRGLFDHMNR